jgi:hypothetical protein
MKYSRKMRILEAQEIQAQRPVELCFIQQLDPADKQLPAPPGEADRNNFEQPRFAY